MSTVIDISEIKTEWGSFYEKNKQSVKDLHRELRFGGETDKFFKNALTEDTQKKVAKSEHDRVIQPFQKAFTPIGTLAFKPHTIPLYHVKIDTNPAPDDFKESWAAFLEGKEIDRAKWPVIRWYIANELLPQFREDWELFEIFNGVRAEPTPGTAGALGTAVDGMRMIVNAHITEGRTTTTATGPLATDPALFVQQVEAFMEALPELYQQKPMLLAMDPAKMRLFLRGMDLHYNSNYMKQADMELIRFTQTRIVGLPSMAGSEKIICTPAGNAVSFTKMGDRKGRFHVTNGPNPREVQIYTDWYQGYGFVVPELIFTNDQDLV